jgi:putative PIN family toxin of toxin-antitoxin system
MRVVIDTNVIISALLSDRSLPAHLITLWRQNRLELLIADAQLDEIRRVTRYPKIRERLSPALAGRLVNELRQVATLVSDLPSVTACSDPNDNYLLAMIEAGRADFLITGDKADLLVMLRHAGARIVTVRQFLEIASMTPGDIG